MKRMKGCQMMMRMPAVRMIERKPKGTFDICLFETSLQTTRPSLIFRCNSFSSKLLHYVFILTFFIKFNYKCHIFQRILRNLQYSLSLERSSTNLCFTTFFIFKFKHLENQRHCLAMVEFALLRGIGVVIR